MYHRTRTSKDGVQFKVRTSAYNCPFFQAPCHAHTCVRLLICAVYVRKQFEKFSAELHFLVFGDELLLCRVLECTQQLVLRNS